MLICDRCGRDNPDQLIFCQDCGLRLQRRVVAPTPPSGLAAATGQPAPVPAEPAQDDVGIAPTVLDQQDETRLCPQCQTRNPSASRYCVSCGSLLLGQEQQPEAPSSLVALTPSAAVHVTPQRAEPPPSIVVCDRCQGVSAAGVPFCKFCGASLTATASLPQEPPVKAIGHAGLAGAPDPSAPLDANSQAKEASDRAADLAPGPAKASVSTGQYVPFTGVTSLVSGRLVMMGADGQEGPSFALTGDQIDIGRSEGAIVLADDQYMSARHARLIRRQGRWHLRDLESTNGVYIRLRSPHELCDGDLLLLGVEVLRFELVADAEAGLGPAIQHGTHVFGSPALPRPARLVQRTVEGVGRDVYHLHRRETVIGRESGDIVFTDDPYMSRRHASIRRASNTGRFTFVDLNSSNGSFVAIRGDCVLQDGDSIRVGQHLFRVELAPG